MMRLRRTCCGLLLAALLAGCGRSPDSQARDEKPNTPVRVAAAASLSSVLEQLKPIARQAQHLELLIDSGSSGTLAQQLIHGAPADVFISANTRWMDELQQRGLLMSGTRIDLWANQLVAICPTDSTVDADSLDDLVATTGHIAIGEPDSVPAGQYARQAMVSAGVWEPLKARLLPAADVRAALAYVAHGDAPLGMVYATDATFSPQVRVLFIVPEALHKPIQYPAAVLASSKHPQAAKDLIALLQSKEVTAVARHAGFTTVRDAMGGTGDE